MKKLPHKTFQHRKLVVRRETIALLTPPQLTRIAGGASDPDDPMASVYGGCDSTSNVVICANVV